DRLRGEGVRIAPRPLGERLKNQLGALLEDPEAPPGLLVSGLAVRAKRDRVKECPDPEADVGVPGAAVTVHHAQHQVAAGRTVPGGVPARTRASIGSTSRPRCSNAEASS